MRFHKGDRVACIVEVLKSNPRVIYGDTGVICSDIRERSSGNIRIRWDKHIDGHACGENCEWGYGANAEDIEIKILSEEESDDSTVPEYTDQDLMSFLSLAEY